MRSGNATAPPIMAVEAPSTETPEALRQRLGQFFTPSPIADLMALMIPAREGAYSILDAEASEGSLIAAVERQLCDAMQPPVEIEAETWAIDVRRLTGLQQTLNACGERCAASGTAWRARVHAEDFIEAAVASVRGDWFDSRQRRFSITLLNPPYRKIRSDSPQRALLRSVGIETTNLYTAFLALAIRLLEPGGHLIAITPWSFCGRTRRPKPCR